MVRSRNSAVGRTDFISLAVLFWGLPFVLAGSTIPAGTDIQVRLTKKISTDTAEAKQGIEATAIAPVVVNGQIAIPYGVQVHGVVESVERVSEADDKKPASLQLSFNRIQVGKTALGISAVVAAIDNARETVEADGKIVGINPHEAITSRIEQGINKLKVNDRFAGLAGILEAVKGAVVKDTDPNISYEPGIEMTLRLTTPLVIPASLHIAVPALEGFPSAQALSSLVNSQPFQTEAQGSRRPSDVTNIMFIGSRAEIEAAFAEAGWSGAAQLNGVSKFETAIAMIEQRGYKEAPVSILMLDERPPDLVFQKGNNTFAQRHHLRMWRSPDTFRGRDVWLCSSTHDTGIDYSQRDMTFIHKIDSNIDLERAKVVNDIIFTGKVGSIALVERPKVPQHSRNATGDDIDTDGRMAVLLLK
jgi:hypothetical protein